MDNLEHIFDEILNEANDGLRYDGINIKFHTLDKISLSGTYNDVPVLIIKNKKEIINKLKTYVDIVLKQKKLDINKSNIKKCLSLLWSCACYEDFSRPNMFIDNRINFYINDDFLGKDKEYNNIVIKKRVEPIYKETPYAFKAYLKKGDKKYYLPSINYGISNDTCYVYNITSSKNDDELIDEIEAKYDVELLSLSLFIKELYNYGIGKIKVASCMPMRTLNEEIISKFDNIDELFSSIIIESNPFEVDEYLNVDISRFDGKNKASFSELLKEE